jgi:hypothetical protein
VVSMAETINLAMMVMSTGRVGDCGAP